MQDFADLLIQTIAHGDTTLLGLAGVAPGVRRLASVGSNLFRDGAFWFN